LAFLAEHQDLPCKALLIHTIRTGVFLWARGTTSQ
jgi:hypothetical protein